MNEPTEKEKDRKKMVDVLVGCFVSIILTCIAFLMAAGVVFGTIWLILKMVHAIWT